MWSQHGTHLWSQHGTERAEGACFRPKAASGHLAQEQPHERARDQHGEDAVDLPAGGGRDGGREDAPRRRRCRPPNPYTHAHIWYDGLFIRNVVEILVPKCSCTSILVLVAPPTDTLAVQQPHWQYEKPHAHIRSAAPNPIYHTRTHACVLRHVSSARTRCCLRTPRRTRQHSRAGHSPASIRWTAPPLPHANVFGSGAALPM